MVQIIKELIHIIVLCNTLYSDKPILHALSKTKIKNIFCILYHQIKCLNLSFF